MSDSRSSRIFSALTAAKPMKAAMGGLVWMFSGGRRLGNLASRLFSRPRVEPVPQDMPDEPAARFAAFQEFHGMSDAEVEARRASARSYFLSYAIATIAMVVWAIISPALGLAPGLTKILPWVLLLLFAAKTVRWSLIHHHLHTRRLTPFREWVKDPANILLPVFESGHAMRSVVRTAALLIIGLGLSPSLAWAQGVSAGDMSSLITVLTRDFVSGDISLQWIQRLFPSFFSSVTGVSVEQDALAQMLGLVNTMLVAACAFMVIWETLTGVVHAAHNGKAFSDRFHGLYAPVRVVVGIGMVVPVAGYCMAQILLIYLALGGYKLANEVWRGYVAMSLSMSQAQGPGLTPEGRWAITPGGGAVTVPPDIVAQLPAFQAVLAAETCYQAARWASRTIGNTQTPPERPTIRQSPGLRNGQRPLIALPPVEGVEIPGGRRWEYGQLCGSVTWTVRPASSTTAIPPAAPNQVVLRLTAENRTAEREQAMREFDIARATAFSRLVGTVRNQRVADMATALASPGYIPEGEAPDINAMMREVMTGYGTFKSDILAASSRLSASLNRDARAAMMDRVNTLGWAAAGAMQPALVRANKTVVDRVMEDPAIESINPGALAMPQQVRDIYSTAQRQLTEALYAALPNTTPSQRNPGTGASRGFPEIDAVRDLRTDPQNSLTRWLSRVSESLFLRVEGMARLDATDPLSSIQNHGQLMEATLVSAWATWATINAISGGAMGAADGVGQSFAGWFGAGAVSKAVAGAIDGVIRGIASFVVTFFWWAFALSALYSTVLPMLGYIFWMFAIAGCIVFLVEGVVGAAFWAFSHVRTDSSGDFVGPAQRHGYVILFNFLFRPMLMVIGLVVGHIVFATMASFVNATYGLAAGAAFSGESFYGSRIMSPVSILVLMATLFYIHYQLAVRAYSLITQLPDRVARWSGSSGENLGEESDFNEASRTVVGGVMVQTRAMSAVTGGAKRPPGGGPEQQATQGPGNAVQQAAGGNRGSGQSAGPRQAAGGNSTPPARDNPNA